MGTTDDNYTRARRASAVTLALSATVWLLFSMASAVEAADRRRLDALYRAAKGQRQNPAGLRLAHPSERRAAR